MYNNRTHCRNSRKLSNKKKRERFRTFSYTWYILKKGWKICFFLGLLRENSKSRFWWIYLLLPTCWRWITADRSLLYYCDDWSLPITFQFINPVISFGYCPWIINSNFYLLRPFIVYQQYISLKHDSINLSFFCNGRGELGSAKKMCSRNGYHMTSIHGWFWVYLKKNIYRYAGQVVQLSLLFKFERCSFFVDL